MTYISWFSDIGLYLEDYLMYKAVTLAGGIREPLLTCSSCPKIHPWGRAGLKVKMRTLLKCIFDKIQCVLEETYTDSLSDMGPPFDKTL